MEGYAWFCNGNGASGLTRSALHMECDQRAALELWETKQLQRGG